VAEQLVAKERELVAREQAVRDAEKERLAQKELELSKREAELDRRAQEARLGAKPTSSAQSDDDSGADDTLVTVQLHVVVEQVNPQKFEQPGRWESRRAA